jgi:TPR repeat protein
MGDFAAARLVLRPAAEAGGHEAALLLGATYDPAALSDLGALGLAPDPNMARAWYQRAMEAGSVEASRRIERLTRTAQ